MKPNEWRIKARVALADLRPGRWLGYSADTGADDARKHAARRLGCGTEELEVKDNGGAVLVRRRKDADQSRDE